MTVGVARGGPQEADDAERRLDPPGQRACGRTPRPIGARPAGRAQPRLHAARLGDEERAGVIAPPVEQGQLEHQHRAHLARPFDRLAQPALQAGPSPPGGPQRGAPGPGGAGLLPDRLDQPGLLQLLQCPVHERPGHGPHLTEHAVLAERTGHVVAVGRAARDDPERRPLGGEEAASLGARTRPDGSPSESPITGSQALTSDRIRSWRHAATPNVIRVPDRQRRERLDRRSSPSARARPRFDRAPRSRRAGATTTPRRPRTHRRSGGERRL